MLDLSVLKQAKRMQRITYKELEEITGVSKTDICKICNSQCVTVNLQKVDLIRKALGIKREALLLKDRIEEGPKEEVMKGQIQFQ